MTRRQSMQAAAFAGGWAAVRRLPPRLTRAVFRAGGSYVARRGGRGVEQLRRNLARVVRGTPALAGTNLDALTTAAMRSYARYWHEVFRLESMSAEEIVDGMHAEGLELLQSAYAEGNGLILVLPHSGNWDFAGAWLAAIGVPFTTVAERLEPASVFQRFVAFRESLGMEVIPLTGGVPPFDVLAARLREGRALCLLADRDLPGTGREVQFFGEPASMPVGPALLAIRTGAPLLPVSSWFDAPKPWNLRIHDRVPDPAAGSLAARVVTMTQTVADHFAEGIAAHPADWHMLAPFWTVDRSGPSSVGNPAPAFQRADVSR